MTEDQLLSMSEQEIRARFRCAPDYYLQAKLDKKRVLEGRVLKTLDQRTGADAETRWQTAMQAQSQFQASLPQSEELDVFFSDSESAGYVPLGRESLDLALPGFEILDAALSESEREDDASLETMVAVPGLTQQAILEAALEDYGNWPIRGERASESELEPEPTPASELERKLTLVLDAEPEIKMVLEPDLEMVLELEPELEVVLDSAPDMQQALESEPLLPAGNVTRADFGNRAPRTVPVVSVIMDRKRPNMVRVVGKSTRLAS